MGHPPDATPQAIRAALIGDEVDAFDREFREVLADTAESLDPGELLATLERWRRVAWSSQDDPEAHRRMLEQAERLNAGDHVDTTAWRDLPFHRPEADR